jgi:hypothetical protein
MPVVRSSSAKATELMVPAYKVLPIRLIRFSASGPRTSLKQMAREGRSQSTVRFTDRPG